jgi:hypothetical protein
VNGRSTNDRKTWAETDGAGEHTGAWGIEGAVGYALAYVGTLILIIGCPAFAIYMLVPKHVSSSLAI